MPTPSTQTLAGRIVAGMALAGGLLAHGGAMAGACPPEHVLTEPREIERAPDVGVGRETLATVDLTGWHDLGHFMLRTRRLTIAADAIVPTHSHGDRPSIVYIVNGELIEYSNFCAVPIVHRAGEAAPESGEGHAHWWENRSGEEVIVLSSDVIPFEDRDHPHM